MGETVPGGRYFGADGRLHDAHGKHLDAGDPDAEALAEQRRSAGIDATSVVATPAKGKAKGKA